MPQTVILEDGTEMEVPDEAELEELQTKAKQAETLAQEIEKMKAESQDNNPNWKAVRAKLKRTEDKLKEQGKALDDEGNIVDTTSHVSSDDIIRIASDQATKTATTVMISQYKDELLSDIDGDDRKAVEYYFTKLSAGEELSFDTVKKFVTDAKRMVMPDNTPKPRSFAGTGLPPRYDVTDTGAQRNKSYGETEEGKGVAKEIWGDTAFSAKDNQ